MRSAKVPLRAEIEKAEANKGLLLFGRTLKSDTNEAIRDLESDFVSIFRAHAPEDTGRLKKGIRAITEQGRSLTGNTGRFSTGLNVAVVVTAKAPKTGFDYVAATRFGHNVAYIYPTKKYLKFTNKLGDTVFTKRVRPKIVTEDWAVAAQLEAQHETDRAAVVLSRRLGSRLV